MTKQAEMMARRQAVQDACVSYALALDTRDWPWLRRLFTTTAVAVYGGELGTRDGYDSIEAACRRALEPLTSSQHLMSNHLVSAGEREAEAVTYFQATHLRSGTAGGELYTVAGRYDDRLVADGDTWRIAHKTLTVQWTDGNPAVLLGGSDRPPQQ